MLSNVRDGSGYGAGVQQVQVQTPRPDVKMPPVGNFAPPSASKENKKRRGGPGSQMTGGAAAIDTGAGPSGLNNRNGARGNASKVSDCFVLKTSINTTATPRSERLLHPTHLICGIQHFPSIFPCLKYISRRHYTIRIQILHHSILCFPCDALVFCENTVLTKLSYPTDVEKEIPTADHRM